MGRKIPAKKHRGVKDPLAQQAQRLQRLKGKINAPPKDPDEQPVPRSLTRLFNFQNPTTKTKDKKKHSATSNYIQGGRNIHNPVSQLKRLPGESGRSFSLRINGAVRALHGTAEELDYAHLADAEEDDVKGERMDEQRRRRERKRRRALQPANAGGGGDGGAVPEKLTRGQRLSLKKKAKQLKRTENEESREVVYDRVSFGEVAHAPPALRFNTKNIDKAGGAPRPGRRGLLLSGLLGEDRGEGRGEGRSEGRGAGRGAGRGEVPPAERLRLERARQAAVDAYRALRAQPTGANRNKSGNME